MVYHYPHLSLMKYNAHDGFISIKWFVQLVYYNQLINF